MDNKIKYEDLKCEFCDGAGEFSRDNSDSVAIEGECSYCNGTGIDQDKLKECFINTFGTQEPCAICGCSLNSHREDTTCPEYAFGEFGGWRDTKFIVR